MSVARPDIVARRPSRLEAASLLVHSSRSGETVRAGGRPSASSTGPALARAGFGRQPDRAHCRTISHWSERSWEGPKLEFWRPLLACRLRFKVSSNRNRPSVPNVAVKWPTTAAPDMGPSSSLRSEKRKKILLYLARADLKCERKIEIALLKVGSSE